LERTTSLLAWQWEGYAQYHQSRFNLLLHIVLVPAFIAGSITFVIAVMGLNWLWAGASLLDMVVSMALQGRGHRGETNPAVPFTGFGNALARVFLEQWVTFPRFVLTGGWWRALRAAG
jgi:hypothetical protein